VRLRTEPRVVHHLGHRCIARGLVRPLDPGKHYRLVILRLNCAAKVGELALLDVIAPALEHASGTILYEYRVAPLRVFDELLLVSLRHRDHKPIDIAHVCTPDDRKPDGRYAVAAQETPHGSASSAGFGLSALNGSGCGGFLRTPLRSYSQGLLVGGR